MRNNHIPSTYCNLFEMFSFGGMHTISQLNQRWRCQCYLDIWGDVRDALLQSQIRFPLLTTPHFDDHFFFVLSIRSIHETKGPNTHWPSEASVGLLQIDADGSKIALRSYPGTRLDNCTFGISTQGINPRNKYWVSVKSQGFSAPVPFPWVLKWIHLRAMTLGYSIGSYQNLRYSEKVEDLTCRLLNEEGGYGYWQGY